VKAPRFSHVVAESVTHAVQFLQPHGDAARVLAGGQSLVPALNMRLSQPKLLIDIDRLDASRASRLAATGCAFRSS
jgi:CO/xanthine dehydrogenase FAD-binding subunit